MKLYEIDGRIAQVIENGFALDGETGEVFTCDELEELEIERNKKIEAVACYIKDLSAEVDAFKAEEKRLAERRKAKENRVGELKEYLLFSMRAHGDRKIDTPRARVTLRKSTKVEITDASKVDCRFKTTVEDIKIDKRAIAEDIKAGRDVRGAKLVENQNLVIS